MHVYDNVAVFIFWYQQNNLFKKVTRIKTGTDRKQELKNSAI